MMTRAATHATPRRPRDTARPPVPPGPDAWPFGARRRPGFMDHTRTIRRLVLLLGWIAIGLPCQFLFLALPGSAKITFPRRFWARVTAILGVKVQCIGQPARAAGGRGVVYVSNHSSWVDIAVVGGCLEGCFVAKDDVQRWPVIRTIARLGRTVFVSRQRASTVKERDEMQARLTAGDALILFPEGTTSDGARVLPFRTPFFAIAAHDPPPIFQPVTVVYDRLSGLPVGRRSRAAFSWYGDMDLASHFAQFGQLRGMRASVVLHTPLDPRDFADRKALAQAVWQIVADSAARLRQNRPVTP